MFLAAVVFIVLAVTSYATAAAGDRILGDDDSFFRRLAIGDFKELNKLIKPAILRLADTSVSRDMISFDVRNLRCTSFQVGDMTVSSKKDNLRRVSVPLNIIDLDMVCTFDYSYWAALIFSGGGSAKVTSSGNDILAKMAITTNVGTLATRPPNKLVFEQCDANVIINDINFQGGVAAWVANAIEGNLRGKIAAMAKTKICQTLDDWSRTTIADQLKAVGETLAKYPARYKVDPLSLEKALVAPEFVTLLNLREKDNGIAKYVHMALDETVSYFGTETYDLDGEVPGPGPTDMNINIFMRNSVLDSSRSLRIDASDVPFAGVNGLIWQGTDRLTKTSIYLNRIKVKGLDTFTRFEPLVDIGDYTLQSKLSWEYLEFECDVTFLIRPSDRKDTVLINPGMDIEETATFTFRIEDVGAIASLLLAIDQGLLEAVEVGSLLRTSKMSPCFLSTIFDVAVSGMSLNLNDVKPPSLVGFVSPGIDRVFGGVMDASFVVFRDLLLAKLPTFFNTAVREYVNDNVLKQYWSYAESEQCSWTSSSDPSDGTIDLRDLLLTPDDAVAAGASGKEPYGNLFSSVLVPMLDGKLVSPDDNADGLPLLNDHLIRPITKIQSGAEGTLAFNTDLFAIESPSMASSSTLVQLRASNLTIKNLDTIDAPVKLLKPTGGKNLNNQVTLGPVSRRPLKMSSKVVMAISGENSPLKMYNDLEIEISVPSSELLFDIFAAIKEDRLLSFPLQDIDNYHCWLDTVLPSDRLNNDTNSNEDVVDRNNLDLSRFFVSLSDIRLYGRCVECSSSGLLALNDILSHIQGAGLSMLLQARLGRLAEEIVWEYWQQMELQRMLAESPARCPHSPRFDENKLLSQLQPVEFTAPTLSVDSLETVAGVCALAAETAFIVAAKSHPSDAGFSDPLSGQKLIQSSTRFIDLENLENIIGTRSFSAISSAHDYLTGDVKDDVNGGTDLGFNVLIRQFFLNGDGGLTIPMGVPVNVGGANFVIDTVRVQGLDSVSTINTLLKAIGPQTLKTSLTFDRLQVYVDIRVEAEPANGTEEEENMTLSFGMNGVSMDLALLFAADQEQLSLLELGSMMHFDKIPGCLLSRVEGIELTQLVLNANGVDAPEVEGFLSTKFRYDTNTILQSTHEAFYDDIMAGLPHMFDDTVRKIFNDALGNSRKRRDGPGDSCQWSNELRDTGLIDFRDLFLSEEASKAQGGRGNSPFGDLMRIVYQNLNSRILNAVSINSFVRSWTKSQSGVEGSAWYQGQMFNSSSSVKIAGFKGQAEIMITDPMVENVDSVVEPLAFMEPVEGLPNELRNIASFGDGEKRFHLGGRVTVALSDGDKLDLRNEIDASLSLTSFSYILQFFLNIPQSRLYSFPLTDFFNINCWLAAILSPWEDALDVPSAGVVDQKLQAEGFDIDVSCVSCSSPRFDDLLSHLYSPNGADNEEGKGNILLDTAVASIFGGGFLRDRLLIEASRHCPHNDAYDPEAKWGESFTTSVATTESEEAEKDPRDSKAMWFNIAMAIVTGVVLFVVATIKVVDRRRHQKWIQSLDDEGFTLFRQQQAKEDETEKALTEEMCSLFKSMSIPRRVRYGVPLAIVADIGLFTAGLFAAISAVDLTGHVAGEAFYIADFLTFDLVSSIIRTYQNGGNEMAIFMLIFSGIYPYLKLAVLTVVWFVPPRLLGGVKRRGKLLLWMDVLAKLSVIDIVTMLLLAAVVLVFIGGPAKALSSDTGDLYYSVEAIVTPLAGFYCLTAAQRISRIGSKYLLEWHLRVVGQATKEYEMRMALPSEATTVMTSYSDESKEEEEADESSLHVQPSGTTTIESSRNETSASVGLAAVDDGATLECLGWSASSTSNYQASSRRGACSERQQQGAKDGRQSPFNYNDELTESSLTSRQGRGLANRLSRIGGIAGAAFSAITVCSVFIIGIVIGPSIKLDLKSLWQLALESGKSFEEAIQASFFRTISSVLLQARFIMRSSRADYIGLLILFCLVVISSILFPLTQAIIKFGKWQRQRAKRKKYGLPKKKKTKMPPYIRRLYLLRGMDVYIISFVLALWQLGAVSAYVIHLYCSLLEKLFSSLAYIGLAESSEAQCFRIQASLPLTVFIICASFLFLTVSFYFQSSENYKRNTKLVEMMIENEAAMNRSFRRGLSSTTRSSSFWNLGHTQLIDDVNEDVAQVGCASTSIDSTTSSGHNVNHSAETEEESAGTDVVEYASGRTSPPV